MFEWLQARVLRVMRVPHEPHPPAGAPGSLRVFRAGLNQYRLSLAAWAIGQSGALVGIGFSLVFLGAFESGVERARVNAATPEPSPSVEAARADAPTATPAAGAPEPKAVAMASPEARASRAERRAAREQAIRSGFLRFSGVLLPLIWVLEIGGLLAFVAQVFFTYAVVRLEFDQHWYMVTDRSLRIRTGILRLQESTMSFANVQQVEIRQGPLQRVLGLADVLVRSAGGGEATAGGKGHAAESTLHLGTFEGVENAEEIRDLILARLRSFREAGLGDPEEAAVVPTVLPERTDISSAAAEALAAARELRQALTSR